MVVENGGVHGYVQLLMRYLPTEKPVLEILGDPGCASLERILENYGGNDAGTLAGVVREPPVSYKPLGSEIVCVDYPPQCDQLLAGKEDFGAVLVSAATHITDENIFEFAMYARKLLNPGAVIVFSSFDHAGKADGNEKEELERCREIPADELQLLFERIGFRFITRHEGYYAPGRTHWFLLVMERGKGAVSKPVDEIETIISHDRKVTTYKLALLRALCDIAQSGHCSVRWRNDGFVEVPMGLIVERWLFYYWPIVEEDERNGDVRIPQGQGGEKSNMLAFRRSMRGLIGCYKDLGGIYAMYNDFMSGSVPPDIAPFLRNTVKEIYRAIREGPVKFAGGSIADVDRYFYYERSHGSKGSYDSSRAVVDTLGKVIVRAGAWREMCLIGHWISESLILRWAELTHKLSKGSVSIERAVSLLLPRPEIERDVREARQAFRSIPDLRCTWTARRLVGGFAVDHVIPFSIAHTNDLWNLVPAQERVNGEKSDKLVTAATLDLCRNRIFNCWEILLEMEPVRFELETKRSLIRSTSYASGWMEAAFSGLKERVEILAIMRGTQRWDSPLARAEIERLGI